MNNLLTPGEVAKILNCSVKTIYGYAETGKIPAFKLAGLLRFNLVEIEKWIEQGRMGSEPLKISFKKTSNKSDIDKIVNMAIEDTKKPQYNPSGETRPYQVMERRR